MRYPPDILDEIRARLPVSSVVGKTVRLRKAGREWKALSPFNAEKTPSFYVNDQKGFYHCFSSGKHGDVFTFLMETEGVSFPEAVERLAADAGVALPKSTYEARGEEDRRKSLHEVMEFAAAYFEAQLAGKLGRNAREYLGRREIGAEIQRRFRIGYAPLDRFGLRDHLAGKGVSAELMAELGLVVTGEDVSVPYDRFRDRVIFPIADPRGRVIAFGGRALGADVPAKYLNSPDTPLFHKGRTLYNIHLARQAAHDRGTVIAVEGYVDVIAMTQAGFANTVAPLGTALTEDQLSLLWRMASEPVLCFDGDAAGRRAAYRAVDVALPNLESGRALRFALLPDGQDPDDLVRSGHADVLERVVGGARPLIDMLWARETEAGPLDTPERRAGLERRLRDAIAQIRDETLKRYYREDVEARLGALHGTGPRFAQRGKPRGDARFGPRFVQAPAGPKLPPGFKPSVGLSRSSTFTPAALGRSGKGGLPGRREALILAILFNHPYLLHGCDEGVVELELSCPEADKARAVLLDCAAVEVIDAAVVSARLERAGLRDWVANLLAHVRHDDRWALDPSADPARVEHALHQAIILQRKAHTLNSELRVAERALAEDQSESNFAWLCHVLDQISSLQGAEADLDGAKGGAPRSV